MSEQSKRQFPTAGDAPPSLTVQAQTILLGCEGFKHGVNMIRDQLLSSSIRDYFEKLLKAHGIPSYEAVRRAELDKDFGRQLLIGERMGRRDYYIQLAIGMGLSLEETQSMLAYLGIGPLYALRRRDAAVMYALKEAFSLMDTQLLLDQYGLTPLGDAEDEFSDFAQFSGTHGVRTVDMEQRLKNTSNFDTLNEDMNDYSARVSVNTYFSRLLSARGLTRKETIALAGLSDKSNLVFQLLNGTRTARNRDLYIRLALAMKLTLGETQSMLKFLKKGTLYPLKERDAALVFCISRGYNIEQTQNLLEENGLPPL